MNDFNEFWSLYPRRVSKRAAQKAWDKETRQTPADEIIAGLRRQLSYLASKDPQFIPHPTTWLNQARWEDEIQPVSKPRNISDAARQFVSGNDYRSGAFGLPSLFDGRH